MNIYDKLVNKETKLALIGLGYVGLPIALEFAKKIKVVGFDINQKRVDMMKNNIDPSDELVASDFEGCDIEFTADIDDLKECTFFIVAVPTPIDESKEPNIKPLLGASTTVGKALKKGDYVVYESIPTKTLSQESNVWRSWDPSRSDFHRKKPLRKTPKIQPLGLNARKFERPRIKKKTFSDR